MFVYVEVDYHDDKEWEAVDWDGVKASWPLKLKDEKPRNKYEAFSFGHESTRLTLDEAEGLVEAGVKVRLIAPPGQQFTKMRDRAAWEPGQQVTPETLRDGSAANITIADFALLNINEVTWLEDACTEQLQERLDEGWRILAVCPPCAARRPDYILGRNKGTKS